AHGLVVVQREDQAQVRHGSASGRGAWAVAASLPGGPIGPGPAPGTRGRGRAWGAWLVGIARPEGHASAADVASRLRRSPRRPVAGGPPVAPVWGRPPGEPPRPRAGRPRPARGGQG